ncbi:DgyrCDS500 [Dimorphilus gyrociliatus]|uniref:DgyrCDS500 n=1 Tax=Dimorphilus gyrociliatus TaxID=2664684 RepID=A0A7I8V620_9ANNE|nr:DgyrCDS500 [Dimorphilus gyrociliatus]
MLGNRDLYMKGGQELRVSCITWNTAECTPPPELEKLVKYNPREYPDVIAIGLQEIYIANLSVVGLGEDLWTSAIKEALGALAESFILIKTIRMWNMQLLVWIRLPWLHYVHNIETSYTRTNFGGLLGSKGAVSVRFEIGQTSICFVNSHLTAHLQHVNERIRDYDDIIETQTFKNSTNILDHDYIYWLGDLNFRINNLDKKTIEDHITSNEYDQLLANDQLKKSMNEGLIFLGFKEGPINFPPTYKFDVNSDKYDTGSKQRKPAYTDRILYYTSSYSSDDDVNKSFNVLPMEYRAKMDSIFQRSDHRPVIANFRSIVYAHFIPRIKFAIQPIVAGDINISYYVDNGAYKPSSWDWIALVDVNCQRIITALS